MARAWGVWTRSKLELLERYLDEFTTTTKFRSPRARVYLDLFGGEPENVDSLTHDPIDGSARIAMDTADPPFTHLCFFELPPKAAKLRATLKAEYPGRNVDVYEGDSNDTIHQALQELHDGGVGWAPTFAFIDPNGPHYRWSTLEALAAHKGEEARTKVELWMLFPAPLFMRMLPNTGIVRPVDDHAISAMYGTAQWHATLEAKLRGAITPGQARAEYVNLMRWRLQRQLGYQCTYQLLVNNEQNRPLYYMIFATDSDAGARIMKHLYARAAVEFPQMAERHRAIRARRANEADGVFDLFSTNGIEIPVSASAGHIALPNEPPEEPRPHDPAVCPLCNLSWEEEWDESMYDEEDWVDLVDEE